MNIGQIILRNRKEEGITREQLADRLGLPVTILKAIEEPDAPDDELLAELAKAFNLPLKQFTGETRKLTTEEKQDTKAKFPAIRKYIIDPAVCRNPAAARELFGDEAFPLAERNLLLYLSTTALYHFCDRSTSTFDFEKYLFRLHDGLVARLEKQLRSQKLSEADIEERLAVGRGDVFACEQIETIAIMVMESFAAELEEKLATGEKDFNDDIDAPFAWDVEADAMRLVFYDGKGRQKDTVKLLDVKARWADG